VPVSENTERVAPRAQDRERLSSGAAPTPARAAALWSAVSLPEVRWAAVATVLFAVGGLTQLAGGPAPAWWALYLSSYAAGGWEPALSGLAGLRRRVLDVDILMIVAAVIAAGIGQVFDGALLIVIFASSGALEAFVTRRTADSVSALLTLAPERATRLTDGGGEEEVDTSLRLPLRNGVNRSAIWHGFHGAILAVSGLLVGHRKGTALRDAGANHGSQISQRSSSLGFPFQACHSAA